MKSNIKELDTTGISEKLVDFFSDQGVEETARQTGFVRRKSAITGLNFLKARVLVFLEKSGASLNELAQSFLDVGVEVTPQGDCGLSSILGWRRERILTELYARLIGIVIVHFLLAPLRIPDKIFSEREVSNVRFQQVLARFARPFKQCLSDAIALAKILDDFVLHVQRFSLTQKRRQQPKAYSHLAQLVLPLA